jgi:hypothetical protein
MLKNGASKAEMPPERKWAPDALLDGNEEA